MTGPEPPGRAWSHADASHPTQNLKSKMPEPKKKVYYIEIFEGCESGRITQLSEPIDIDHQKIDTSIISDKIREVVREVLGVE